LRPKLHPNKYNEQTKFMKKIVGALIDTSTVEFLGIDYRIELTDD